MLPGVSAPWVVCEDGTEYLDRFSRFLSGFTFVHATCAATLVAAVERGAAGVLLDLDFRRTPAERLIGEKGAPAVALDPPARRRLAERQGILLLRHLRARGHAAPVILCADLGSDEAAYLEAQYVPLAVVGSHEGLAEIGERMRKMIALPPK